MAMSWCIWLRAGAKGGWFISSEKGPKVSRADEIG
jgi:hypothetical protein